MRTIFAPLTRLAGRDNIQHICAARFTGRKEDQLGGAEGMLEMRFHALRAWLREQATPP
jgi:hypothetical protein